MLETAILAIGALLLLYAAYQLIPWLMRNAGKQDQSTPPADHAGRPAPGESAAPDWTAAHEPMAADEQRPLAGATHGETEGGVFADTRLFDEAIDAPHIPPEESSAGPTGRAVAPDAAAPTAPADAAASDAAFVAGSAAPSDTASMASRDTRGAAALDPANAAPESIRALFAGPGGARVRRDAVLLAVVSIVAALAYYAPFMLRLPSIGGIPFAGQTMDRVYGMWDGPIFVTEAKTLWDPNPFNPAYSWLGEPPSYYAEHFPLYPLLIRAVSPLFGYWNGSLIVNLVVSTAVIVLLYIFLRRFSRAPGAAFWIALIFIFWPPRGFFYRYAPMSEPLFILGVLAAAYFFKTRNFTLCGLFGAVAVASRPNSFLLMAAFGALALSRLWGVPPRHWTREIARMSGLLLMPLAFLLISAWYALQFGDWLAAFHASTFDRPVFDLYPFLRFFHIGEEGTSYTFLLCLAGIVELARRRHWDLVVLSLAFYLPAFFVNADVERFMLPILPFVYALAGDRLLASKPVRIALILSIPMIYTYAWSTLLDPGYQAPFGPLRALLP